MTTDYTDNFKLNLPDFRMGPWHDLINNNTVTIDQLLMSVLQGVDTRPWDNNVHFLVGMTAIDSTDNTFWVCVTEHTSAPLPTTFAQDRAAHPTYWNRVVVGIAPRGEWMNSTHYLPNDMVTDPNEGIIGLCKTEHVSSPPPATIRTDAIYWTFLTDFHGTDIRAADVSYNNTATGVAADDVQEALDTSLLGLAAKANINSPTFTGVPQAPTPPLGDNTTKIATTNFVTNSIILGAGGVMAVVFVSPDPPTGSIPDNALWWESDTGYLYIKYNDGTSTQWVVAVPQIDWTIFLQKSGGTMTGPITLAADPVAPMQAATKQYADTKASPASVLALSGRQTTTGGFRHTTFSVGNIGAGQTFTPDAYNGNYQYYINTGAHTFAAPAFECGIDVLIGNSATAGAITFSGFMVSANTGDVLTTANNQYFIVSVRKILGVSTYVIKAMQ